MPLGENITVTIKEQNIIVTIENWLDYLIPLPLKQQNLTHLQTFAIYEPNEP